MATTQSHQQNSQRRASEHNLASEARDLIEEKVGRENLDVLFGFLQNAGEICMRGIRQTTSYARRHPVRVGLTVIAIGLLGSALAKSREKETLH